jgi:integrase/recombinase XerD
MELNEFENYLLRRNHTAGTIKSYLFSITPFAERFPELDYFTFKDMKEALSEFLKNHKNQNSKNTILASIKKYYDCLLETGQRNDHPCRTLRFKATRNTGVIHSDLFTSVELEQLLERQERYPALKARNQGIASLLIYQGLQLGEVARLEVQHVNFDTGKIYVKESRMGLRRHLEMHPKQYGFFESYINESRKQLLKIESNLLFISTRGIPSGKDDIRYVVETFKHLFPDRNLNPESIRQSVISIWLNEKRFPLEQVQLMAGHKWISTTVRYRQAPTDERRLIINRLHPLA